MWELPHCPPRTCHSTLAGNIHLVEDNPQHLGSRLVQLILYPLGKPEAYGIALDHHDGTVALLGNNGGINNASQGRSIYDHIVKYLLHILKNLAKYPASQKFTGVRRHRPCKNNVKIGRISLADNT